MQDLGSLKYALFLIVSSVALRKTPAAWNIARMMSAPKRKKKMGALPMWMRNEVAARGRYGVNRLHKHIAEYGEGEERGPEVSELVTENDEKYG